MTTLNLNIKEHSRPFNLNAWQGCHGSKGPIVGSHSGELDLIQEAIKVEPILGELETVLYYKENSASFDCLVNADKKVEADAISRTIFANYLKKYESEGITVDNAVEWSKWGPEGEARILDQCYYCRQNQLGTWHVHATVRNENTESFLVDGKYLSPYLKAYHEILHVEQIPPLASSKFIEDHRHKGSELLQKIKTIILADEVNKQIYCIGNTHEVDYGKAIELGNKTISIGSIANFYRGLEEKHGSLFDGILSQASIEFLKK